MSEKEKLEKYFNAWVEYCNQVILFKDRQPNIPSGLTEGLALVALNEFYGNKYKKAEVGDLCSIDEKEKVEVKASGMGFNRKDCSSFGPTEKFDKLIFVLCDLSEKKVKVFDCNTSYEKMQKLQISKKETFGEQCNQKRRPRFSIQSKLGDQMTLIKEFVF